MMKTFKPHAKNQQSGVGLVEILVAVTISLFLIGGIIQIFQNNKNTYRLQQTLSRLQENARFAIALLSKDIRMAGYSGCSPNVADHLNPAGVGYSSALYDIKAAVGGWEYTGTAPGQVFTISTLNPSGISLANWSDNGGNALPANFLDKVIAGTDVLVTKKLSEKSSIPVTGGAITSAQIGTSGASGVEQYQIVMITEDCKYADLFQNLSNAASSNVSRGTGSSTNPGPGNKNPTSLFSGGPPTPKWSKAYGPGSTILTYDSFAYYVGEGSSGEPTLFRATFGRGTNSSYVTYQELVEGVENFQVLYGEDTDATPDGIANRYVTMNNVTNLQNIVSVRISMLMRSDIENTLDVDSATYALTGLEKTSCSGTIYSCPSVVINPLNEKRLRIVVSTTIKLRNRGANL